MFACAIFSYGPFIFGNCSGVASVSVCRVDSVEYCSEEMLKNSLRNAPVNTQIKPSGFGAELLSFKETVCIVQLFCFAKFRVRFVEV